MVLGKITENKLSDDVEEGVALDGDDGNDVAGDDDVAAAVEAGGD